MPITSLPTPPSRSDPTNFGARADAFFAALSAFVVQFNAMVPATTASSVTGGFAVNSGNCTLGSAANNTTAICAGSAALPALIKQGDTATGQWFPAASTVAWSTGGVERMRLDSLGNVLFGTASTTPGDDTTAWVAHSGGANLHHAPNNAATGAAISTFYRGSVQLGSITQSGTAAVAYNATSDARLKCNITDSPPSGITIDAIRVRSFDWRGPEGEHVDWGFIAQELVQAAPFAVKVGDPSPESDLPVPAESFNPWAVDPSKLVPLLIAEVQALRRRVAALEAPRAS